MRLILGAMLVATGITVAAGVECLVAQDAVKPQVLYWERDGQPNTGTAVGLLYTPDALSALASLIPADAVPRAVAEAIQQRTPIVAMWEVKGAADPQPQPPYQVAIVAEHGGVQGAVQPLWTQQQGGDLARLDARLSSSSERIAAIAAFPTTAFVPGRRVLLRSSRYRTEAGTNTWHQRWGVIRWDGNAMARR